MDCVFVDKGGQLRESVKDFFGFRVEDVQINELGKPIRFVRGDDRLARRHRIHLLVFYPDTNKGRVVRGVGWMDNLLCCVRPIHGTGH